MLLHYLAATGTRRRSTGLMKKKYWLNSVGLIPFSPIWIDHEALLLFRKSTMEIKLESTIKELRDDSEHPNTENKVPTEEAVASPVASTIGPSSCVKSEDIYADSSLQLDSEIETTTDDRTWRRKLRSPLDDLDLAIMQLDSQPAHHLKYLWHILSFEPPEITSALALDVCRSRSLDFGISLPPAAPHINQLYLSNSIGTPQPL